MARKVPLSCDMQYVCALHSAYNAPFGCHATLVGWLRVACSTCGGSCLSLCSPHSLLGNWRFHLTSPTTTLSTLSSSRGVSSEQFGCPTRFSRCFDEDSGPHLQFVLSVPFLTAEELDSFRANYTPRSVSCTGCMDPEVDALETTLECMGGKEALEIANCKLLMHKHSIHRSIGTPLDLAACYKTLRKRCATNNSAYNACHLKMLSHSWKVLLCNRLGSCRHVIVESVFGGDSRSWGL